MSKNFPRRKPTNSMVGAQTGTRRPTIHALCVFPGFQRPGALSLSVLRTRTAPYMGLASWRGDEHRLNYIFSKELYIFNQG
jgi:hypothetical protein